MHVETLRNGFAGLSQDEDVGRWRDVGGVGCRGGTVTSISSWNDREVDRFVELPPTGPQPALQQPAFLSCAAALDAYRN
jgi:hypothetical protein